MKNNIILLIGIMLFFSCKEEHKNTFELKFKKNNNEHTSAHQFSLGVSTIFGDSWYNQSELGMFLNYGGKFLSAFDWKPALYKISNLKLFK